MIIALKLCFYVGLLSFVRCCGSVWRGLLAAPDALPPDVARQTQRRKEQPNQRNEKNQKQPAHQDRPSSEYQTGGSLRCELYPHRHCRSARDETGAGEDALRQPVWRPALQVISIRSAAGRLAAIRGKAGWRTRPGAPEIREFGSCAVRAAVPPGRPVARSRF